MKPINVWLKWLNLAFVAGAIASGFGLVFAIGRAYIWAGGDIDIFYLVVSKMNVLAVTSGIIVLAITIAGNVWIYWVLLGEPKSTLGRIVQPILGSLLTASLLALPLFISGIYFASLIVLIIFKILKVKRERIVTFIKRLFPLDRLYLIGLVGVLVVFLGANAGLALNVTFKDQQNRTIHGLVIDSPSEFLLVNREESSVYLYQKSAISDIKIKPINPDWWARPAAYFVAIWQSKK
jgi:hypothetical protein